MSPIALPPTQLFNSFPHASLMTIKTPNAATAENILLVDAFQDKGIPFFSGVFQCSRYIHPTTVSLYVDCMHEAIPYNVIAMSSAYLRVSRKLWSLGPGADQVAFLWIFLLLIVPRGLLKTRICFFFCGDSFFFLFNEVVSVYQ